MLLQVGRPAVNPRTDFAEVLRLYALQNQLLDIQTGICTPKSTRSGCPPPRYTLPDGNSLQELPTPGQQSRHINDIVLLLALLLPSLLHPLPGHLDLQLRLLLTSVLVASQEDELFCLLHAQLVAQGSVRQPPLAPVALCGAACGMARQQAAGGCS